MSQFFGCIALSQSIDIELIAQKMQDKMAFFAPDKQGIYLNKTVFICNKLLYNSPESINTPQLCETERYILAASCRIDNREELAIKLHFDTPAAEKGTSDHQYILKAYEKYQHDCVKHLIGDFAFVVWDKHEEKLFMAKDHLGVKPLFYTLQQEILFFSSDLNAFLGVDEITKQYSKSYLAGYVQDSYIKISAGLQHTCYENIFRLKPAHFCVYYNNVITETKYWVLAPQQTLNYENENDYYAKFFELFKAAVSKRLRTNDAVGLELSGGLDSSSIACMAGEIVKDKTEKLHAYSFVQSDEGAKLEPGFTGEEPFQEIVLEQLKLNPKNIFTNDKHPFTHYLDEYQYGFEVHGGISKLNFTWQKPIYSMMQANNCSVKLSGFTGDEMVSHSGNNWYYEGLYDFDIKLIGKLLMSFKLSNYKKILWYYYQRIFGHRVGKALKKRNKKVEFLDKKHVHLLPKKEYRRDTKSYQHFLISFICRPFSTLRFETENLHALRFNAECRYPMADIRLLEFVLATPALLHKPSSINRIFIRKALKDILPKVIYERADKSGAVIPYLRVKNNVFKKQLKADDSFALLKNMAFLDTQKIEQQLNNIEHLQRNIDTESLLQVLFLTKI